MAKSISFLDPTDHAPAKKKPKILDGTFYKIVTDDGGRIVAQCSECKELKKGTDTSTGNFKSHYKTKHKDRAKDMEHYLKEIDPSVKAKSNLRQQDIPETMSGSSSENVINEYYSKFHF